MDRNQLLNDAEAATRYALDGRQARIWTCLPAIVSSVNFAHMTIECVPAIQGIQTNPDGSTQYVTLPKLVDVPICFPSAGGFSLTLPISSGDEVLIVFSSRCIDSWWQSGGVQIPSEFRMHDLSDGFAIPGPKSLPKAQAVSNISPIDLQIRNDAGTTFVSIGADGKIGIQNSTTSLKTTLSDFQAALNTFMEAIVANGISEPTTPITWASLATTATACTTSLTSVLVEIDGLLQ